MGLLGGDYIANFSPGSERNPLEIKVAITWRMFSARAENPSTVSETELGFSARSNGLKNPLKVHVIKMEC